MPTCAPWFPGRTGVTAAFFSMGFAILFVLAGCRETRLASTLPADASASRIDVFLRTSGAGGVVVMELASVSVRDEAGEVWSLEPAHARVSSRQGERRIAVAGGVLPPATYAALILEVRAAYMETDGAIIDLRLLEGADPDREPFVLEPVTGEPPAPVVYEIPTRVRLRTRDAASLFLDWRVEDSIVDGTGFRPIFAVSAETPRATLGMLYVTDDATGSLLALERGSGQVVATARVGTEPSALAVSDDLRRLYVANSRDGSLSVVDIRQNLSQSTIPIRFSAQPMDVAVVDPGRVVATANRGLDSVSFFDVVRMARVTDVRVGRAPVRLAVSRNPRRVFVANSLSDNVSVIDVNATSLIASIPVESRPSFVAADARGGEIFVGHRTSQNLLVIDALTLAVVDTIFVGGDVTAILADRRRDRVYVARGHPPEIAVVERRLRAVTRRIPIAGPVRALAQPLEGSRILGAAPDLGGLVVANVVLAVEEPMIPCGARPTDVVVID